MTSCNVGLQMGILLFVLSCICSFEVSILNGCGDIFDKKSGEKENLVYWFTTTGNNMGLKMDILLFVVPCIFLSLYIFRLRYQPYALEALKRGYSQIF